MTWPGEVGIESVLRLVSCGYAWHHRANWVSGPRVYPRYKLVIILAGKGMLEIDGWRYVLKPGTAFALFRNQAYTYWADAKLPFSLSWVSFEPRFRKPGTGDSLWLSV